MRPTHRLDLDPNPDPTPDLDRAWAATRPEPPSAEALDALWAAASRELDRVAAAPMTLTAPRAGRSRPVGLILAQAAALLLAAGLVVARRPAGPVAVVATTPGPASVPSPARTPATGLVVVGVDETAVVRVEEDGHRVDRLAESPGFPALADANQHEVFNALESMATP